MHLKEVIINGFKSFADKTKLDLEPGVIAIVGPNGCGKSNIADAWRGVLGEQSAKARRGDKMKDIIFSGSEKRKPLNLCEVFLKFTDCEEHLGTAFNEVEVGRRVAREGSSDYFINGKVCRLKDIQRLFMDTGVGRVSYSFLLQGQIDQILSSNPSERRVIFEEAAGITKYKAQRRETLNKLNLVEANLARVTDVIDEVGRQIGSLKRQASKALRYQRVQHRLSHLDLAWLAYHFDLRSRENLELKQQESALGQKLDTCRSELQKKEAGLNHARAERSSSQERLQSAQQALYNLKAELEKNQNKIQLSQARQEDLGKRGEQISAELGIQLERREDIEKQLQSESTSRQMQLGLVGDSDALFQERNREVLIAQDKLTQAEKALKQARQDVLMVDNKLTRLRSQVTTLEVEAKAYQGRHAQLSEQVHMLSQEIEQLQAESQNLERARTCRLKDLDEQKARLDALQAKRTGLRERHREKQQGLREKDKQIAAVAAHLGVLEKLNQGLEGLGAGAKAILQNKVDELSCEEAETLSRLIEVPEADRLAVEALLGDAVDAVLLADGDETSRAINGLVNQKLGTAVVRGDGDASMTFSIPRDLPERVRPAFERVKAQTVRAESHLRALLAGCYIVDSIVEFRAYWRQSPELRFARISDAEGRVLRADGCMVGGRGKGEKSSIIQRQSEIRKRKKEREVLQAEMDILCGEHEALQQEIQGAEQQLDEQRAQLSEIRQEASTIEAQQKSVQSNLEKANRAVRRAQQNLSEFEASHKQKLHRLEQAQTALKEGEAEHVHAREQVEQNEADIDRFRDERDSRRDSLADLRLQLAEKRQRLESLDREVSQMKRRLDDVNSLVRQRELERDTIHEQVAKLKEDATHAAARNTHLEESVRVTEEQAARQRDAAVAIDKEVSSRETTLESLRRSEREFATQHGRMEIRCVETLSKIQVLVEKAINEYEADLTKVGWKAQLWAADAEFERQIDLESLDAVDSIEELGRPMRTDPTPDDLSAMDQTDWSAVETEVRELRSRVNAMGPVNLVAIKEYADLAQRFQFLKEQSDDLWNSKNSLIEAIDEINTISTQLFRETFEQVIQNFKYTYDQLTGGGFADLQLVDNEDILDSGIDIVARPPGTRLKNLSLLSGGQKTMTAVALLFAIYMVKPSPFCVLDELDAPLDDANIGRFTSMLKTFTKYSQFVIITHNKRTIAASNVVYGVTMPEKGVSRVISMRFNPDQTESLEPAQAIGDDLSLRASS